MGDKHVNPMEALVDKFVEQLVTTVEKMPESPPFGKVKLSRAEQLERYEGIRDNPNAWGKLIEKHDVDEVLFYAERMEKLRAADQG